MNTNPAANRQIIPYQLLRMLIGLIGFLLPIIILTGQMIGGGWSALSSSISASYYTGCRDILVGSLFVLGFFLLSYRGKDAKENILANSGFFFALGVAMLPCRSSAAAVRVFHYISAGSLFGMFAVFSLWLFRRGLNARNGPDHLKRIDRVYVSTGIVLVASIAAMGAVLAFLPSETQESSKAIFFIETAGLFAFSYAWMTRAHFLWRDPKEYPNRFGMFAASRD